MVEFDTVEYALKLLMVAVNITILFGIFYKIYLLFRKKEEVVGVKSNDECELMINHSNATSSEFNILKVTDALVNVNNLDKYELSKRTKKYKYRDVLNYSLSKYKNNLCKIIVKRIDYVIHKDLILTETSSFIKNMVRELGRTKNTNGVILSKLLLKELSDPYIEVDTTSYSDNGVDIYIYSSKNKIESNEKLFLKIRIKTERKES